MEFNSEISDTSSQAEQVWLGMLRQISPARKFEQICSLSQMVRQLSRHGIARAHSSLSPIQQDILFVKLHYGQELADKLEEYLNNATE